MLQESIDAISWNLSQKEEEVVNMESRIQGLSLRYKEEKQVNFVYLQPSILDFY
jgi:hypothetical protein